MGKGSSGGVFIMWGRNEGGPARVFGLGGCFGLDPTVGPIRSLDGLDGSAFVRWALSNSGFSL